MNVDTLNYRGSGPDGPEGQGGLLFLCEVGTTYDSHDLIRYCEPPVSQWTLSAMEWRASPSVVP